MACRFISAEFWPLVIEVKTGTDSKGSRIINRAEKE
jgi:hypothetical protein